MSDDVDKKAEELLSCNANCRSALTDPLHFTHCHAINRPTVAAVLRKRDAEIEQLNAKRQEYEQYYILPVFAWAKELGFDLSKSVMENPGKNCVELFFGYLRAELAALKAQLKEDRK